MCVRKNCAMNLCVSVLLSSFKIFKIIFSFSDICNRMDENDGYFGGSNQTGPKFDRKKKSGGFQSMGN